MLMKANGADEIDRALTTWRALAPYWNTEADRIRLLVQGGDATVVSPNEIEHLCEMMRRTIASAERLLASCPAGDRRFADLLQAIGECDALLESYQTSLERLDKPRDVQLHAPVRLIVHREAHVT